MMEHRHQRLSSRTLLGLCPNTRESGPVDACLSGQGVNGMGLSCTSVTENKGNTLLAGASTKNYAKWRNSN
eukprot:CAMPEP_0174365010 /NCGR_PEP_ID=MMETSP0811_2-20130205/75428_1 /TAXON_ID=73025 ORGANISM="Eutreptiella gymnastica-like, Strain CCMP1594" /NCGR_SAMPLE_ID=MMETSP0811_2 /ASSEMBLY_ACC=CAM_ASM_000667 /LENGTH=70 /DNA_ID=CAMNT_0015505249 /DNA_START=65 /DNA_END=274 /DNA_ORIENTATION=+